MLDPEVYEEAAVPAANRRRVVATGNRASAERAATQPGRKVAREGGGGGWGRRLAARRPPPARSWAARRAQGLLGWGCHRLWSVKLLAPSVKATWQLGLEDRLLRSREAEPQAAGHGPHLLGQRTPSFARGPPRLSPGPLFPLGRLLAPGAVRKPSKTAPRGLQPPGAAGAPGTPSPGSGLWGGFPPRGPPRSPPPAEV